MYYLDNAATTKVLPEILSVMNQYLGEYYYNPSSVYMPSVNVKKDVEKVRDYILDVVGASNHKVIFTSSATEANNTIFNSVNLRSGDKVLISSVEHPSVYNKAITLREKGVIVEQIKCDKNGVLDLDDLKVKLDKTVKLVSVMAVCNETGVIHNLKEISKTIKSYNRNILFAVDGVQAYGKIELYLDLYNIDFFVLSAHKIHGPKGVGALIYRKDLKIVPLLIGGGQENGLRSGTENVAGIMGLYQASIIAFNNMKANYKFVCEIKDELVSILEKNVNGIIVNGGNCFDVSPYILSVSIPGIRGEVLLHMLEKDEVYISTGSACSSKYFDNRVLSAMGRSIDEIRGSVRISFNAYDVIKVEELAEIILNKINELKGKME